MNKEVISAEKMAKHFFMEPLRQRFLSQSDVNTVEGFLEMMEATIAVYTDEITQALKQARLDGIRECVEVVISTECDFGDGKRACCATLTRASENLQSLLEEPK